jgi:hypothetical protein
MGMDVDDGSFRDTCGQRCVCEVIDLLDGSEGFVEQRDAVQINVVGIGGGGDASSVVVRFACCDQIGQSREYSHFV